MMRIITGTARGVKLDTLEGEVTRPTSERLKEALFSMIQFDIEGRAVLDLFGGSGQLGLEALSRGAGSCTFIDNSREASELIIGNARKCKLFDKCRISTMDSIAFLKSAAGKQSFDVIFIDPPYDAGLVAESLALIKEGGLLSVGGVIAVETGEETVTPGKRKHKPTEEEEATAVRLSVFGGDGALAGAYTVRRSAVYGKSRLTLLEAAE